MNLAPTEAHVAGSSHAFSPYGQAACRKYASSLLAASQQFGITAARKQKERPGAPTKRHPVTASRWDITNRMPTLPRLRGMRTTIVLPNHLHAEAGCKPAHQAVSLSEYIRRLVARDLGKDTHASDPSVIFRLFDSAGSRIADGKQAMIGETIQVPLVEPTPPSQRASVGRTSLMISRIRPV